MLALHYHNSVVKSIKYLFLKQIDLKTPKAITHPNAYRFTCNCKKQYRKTPRPLCSDCPSGVR
jgi:hypothetical protein